MLPMHGKGHAAMHSEDLINVSEKVGVIALILKLFEMLWGEVSEAYFTKLFSLRWIRQLGGHARGTHLFWRQRLIIIRGTTFFLRGDLQRGIEIRHVRGEGEEVSRRKEGLVSSAFDASVTVTHEQQFHSNYAGTVFTLSAG